MRALLLQQLSIPWSLATRHYLPALSDEIASWEPSMNVVKLAEMHGRMIGEWPGEQSDPIPRFDCRLALVAHRVVVV